MTSEMTLDEAKTALKRAEEGLAELVNFKATATGGLGNVNSSIASREQSVRDLRELVKNLSRKD